MKLIRGLYNLKPKHCHCVVTFGNFDGVHLGHRALIYQTKSLAKALARSTLVILFEPHPSEFFLRNKAPARLMRFREKLTYLRQLAVDYVLCLRFSEDFSKISADEFVHHYLVDRLAISGIVVGPDVRFGHQGLGSWELLKTMGKIHRFITRRIPNIYLNDLRISSTQIRTLLAENQFLIAQFALTRPFTLSGHVVYGEQRGKSIGFPTANLLLHRFTSPLKGVFVVRVYGLSKPLPAIANLGCRPTFNGDQEILEVHLLNFNQTIYGQWLEVEFLKKIRDEKKFNNLEQLRHQIHNDKLVSEDYFRNMDS